MEAIEYRIPEYTYTLDIPVRMRGLKSESDKRWEEMLQSLSQQDRAIWEQLEDKTPPSLILAEIRKWLEHQGFSAEGLQTIFDFMSERLSK